MESGPGDMTTYSKEEEAELTLVCPYLELEK